MSEPRYFFIRRPIFGAVISIVITLLGLFAIQLLPVARYPQITPPAVRIQTNYPGASSEDAAQAVAAPIEEQLAGLQGMLYYASSNSSDGSTTINVTFDVSRNQDLAAVDVQNAVKLAEPQLPDAVRTNGITILKANTDILAVVALQSSDPRYDATYLANYMKLFVVDELKRVPGVGDATPFPARDFSMLLQLDPDKMAQLEPHGERHRRRRARTERDEPRRATRRRAVAAGDAAHAADHDDRPAPDARRVQRHRDPRAPGRLGRFACATSAGRCSAREATTSRDA